MLSSWSEVQTLGIYTHQQTPPRGDPHILHAALFVRHHFDADLDSTQQTRSYQVRNGG